MKRLRHYVEGKRNHVSFGELHKTVPKEDRCWYLSNNPGVGTPLRCHIGPWVFTDEERANKASESMRESRPCVKECSWGEFSGLLQAEAVPRYKICVVIDPEVSESSAPHSNIGHALELARSSG